MGLRQMLPWQTKRILIGENVFRMTILEKVNDALPG